MSVDLHARYPQLERERHIKRTLLGIGIVLWTTAIVLWFLVALGA